MNKVFNKDIIENETQLHLFSVKKALEQRTALLRRLSVLIGNR